IRCEWTLRRLDNAETQAWQYQAENTYDEPEKFPLGKSITSYSNTFSKFQYRLDATRRARLRALQALEKLKSEPAPAPPPPPPLPPPPPCPAPPPPSAPRKPQIGTPPRPARPTGAPAPVSIPFTRSDLTQNWLRSANCR